MGSGTGFKQDSVMDQICMHFRVTLAVLQRMGRPEAEGSGRKLGKGSGLEMQRL